MLHSPTSEKVADLLVEWFEKLELPFKRSLIPLAHNWAFESSFLKAWLGVDLVDQVFHSHARDTMLYAIALAYKIPAGLFTRRWGGDDRVRSAGHGKAARRNSMVLSTRTAESGRLTKDMVAATTIGKCHECLPRCSTPVPSAHLFGLGGTERFRLRASDSVTT